MAAKHGMRTTRTAAFLCRNFIRMSWTKPCTTLHDASICSHIRERTSLHDIQWEAQSREPSQKQESKFIFGPLG